MRLSYGSNEPPFRFCLIYSEAYRLALQLYAGRYEVIACKDAAEILRKVIDEYMPKDDEPMPPEK